MMAFQLIWSIAEYLHSKNSNTRIMKLFATHYHGINEMKHI